MGTHAVNVNNFNFWYGDFQALKNLSFMIPALKITSLIGPSGCGKSTFLKCLNRINERSGKTSMSGSVSIFGHDIYHPINALPEIRKDIGMVFQKPNPLPLSVYENIVFGAKTHLKKSELKKDLLDKMVEESLTKVGMWNELKDRLDSAAISLSLEKQQKLCIARLLPLKPKILLLDEPCSALDPKGTLAVEELIKDLKKQYTIIIVTHSMAQAKRVSDETMFMYMGQLVEHGSTEQVFGAAKNPMTLQYIEGKFG
ncbi:MAG: phosphate ABC transporter ATP-binding protein [Bacteriovoracaceae bacterium]|nr:phosphate ABC transporter ATP-binding protein [Bacteriovoracaceae bacterium]